MPTSSPKLTDAMIRSYIQKVFKKFQDLSPKERRILEILGSNDVMISDKGPVLNRYWEPVSAVRRPQQALNRLLKRGFVRQRMIPSWYVITDKGSEYLFNGK